jgi:metal-responsive CopG/Arc/MetJ family transcriptional regulator
MLMLMRISVVIPDGLARELDQCKRQQRRAVSTIVRDALTHYLRETRRLAAGEALKQAAARTNLDPQGLKRALDELDEERGRSDRL